MSNRNFPPSATATLEKSKIKVLVRKPEEGRMVRLPPRREFGLVMLETLIPISAWSDVVNGVSALSGAVST